MRISSVQYTLVYTSVNMNGSVVYDINFIKTYLDTRFTSVIGGKAHRNLSPHIPKSLHRILHTFCTL